jgi:arabinofuranan 3-O-arabinosyltransferase
VHVSNPEPGPSVPLRPAPRSVLLVAYVVFALVPLWAARRADSGEDNFIVVRAARHLLDGATPYADKRFVYPPSSILFALAEAPLPDGVLRHLSPFVCAALLLAAWWAALRLFGVPLRSWLAVLPVGGAALFAPFVNLVMLGSWTAPVAALGSVALLLMGRDRWLLAGLVIGLSIAVKPMLVPLGLVFLLARRWGGFALAAGVPAALAGAMLLLIPDPGRFFTTTVPFLLGGQDDYARPFDISLGAILPRAGLDGPVVLAARVLVAAAALAFAGLRWRAAGRADRRLVETSSIVMLGTFLVSSPGFDHYVLLVLPGLLAGAALPGSPTRTVWFWLALVPQTGAVRIQELDTLHRRALKDWFMVAVLLAGLIAEVVAARRQGFREGRIERDGTEHAPVGAAGDAR